MPHNFYFLYNLVISEFLFKQIAYCHDRKLDGASDRLPFGRNGVILLITTRPSDCWLLWPPQSQIADCHDAPLSVCPNLNCYHCLISNLPHLFLLLHSHLYNGICSPSKSIHPIPFSMTYLHKTVLFGFYVKRCERDSVLRHVLIQRWWALKEKFTFKNFVIILKKLGTNFKKIKNNILETMKKPKKNTSGNFVISKCFGEIVACSFERNSLRFLYK